MPTSRDNEHNGGEFFDDHVDPFPDREEYTKFQEDIIKQLEEQKDAEKAKQQEQWMSLDNPYLWEPMEVD